MSKSVLVTGAAGFIGSHLCESLLAAGFGVTGIDNFDLFYAKEVKQANLKNLLGHPGFAFLEGDAGDPAVLEKIKPVPDAIIHLAAKAGVQPSLANPGEYIETNILLTNRLLEWMKEKGIRKMLFASSSSVYGNTAQVPFHEEQGTDSPFSPYAFTKRSCELMNYTYHQLYGLDIINLRFFTVYGERQRPDLAIHKFIHKIISGQPIQLYGKGDTSRDYTYWKDTVKGISLALDYIFANDKVFETFNLGSQAPVTLHQLVECISSTLAITPVIRYEDKKPGDVDITYADISKARRILGYDPQTSLQEGITQFVHWYRQL